MTQTCKCARIAAALAFLTPAPLMAATPYWPERAVRIVVPWPPGGSTDIVARLLAAELTSRLKQQVIIDNRAGAASIIGLQHVKDAKPDGYTFLLTSTAYGFLIDPPRPPVDYVNSFAPVALIGFGDSSLVVHPSLPVRNVADLIALAKRRPGELNYASSGTGGFPHMNTELLRVMAGIRLTHVPYKGGGPAIADTIAGHTQILMNALVSVIPYVKSERLRLLAVGGPKRNPAVPDVPTIAETVRGYESVIWWGVFAPRAAPVEAIARFHGETIAVLDSPEFVRRLAEQGGEAVKMSASEFGKVMVTEQNKWGELIKAAGIKPE